MTCKMCGSERVATVSGKCSDKCSFRDGKTDIHGYVPHEVGIGGGDYMEFKYCMECGLIQDDFPVELSCGYEDDEEEFDEGMDEGIDEEDCEEDED